MTDAIRTFVVPRSRWFRGKGFVESYLLRDDGTGCCLGHVGRQCGVSDDDLLRRKNPAAVALSVDHTWPEALLKIKNPDVCGQMMGVNDSEELTDPDREAKLQELALKAGFALVFVDDESEVPRG